MKRSGFKYKKVLLWIALGLIPLAIVAVGLFYFLQDAEESTGFVLEEDVSYYYIGQRYSFNAGLRLGFDEDENTINLDNTTQQFPANPLYYNDNQRLILPCKMVYFRASKIANFQIEALTTIDGTGNAIYATKNNSSRQLPNGFLYDGSNIYVFLDAVTLKFNGYTFELGPLSYVEANAAEGIMLYNTTNGEIFYEIPKTAVTAYCLTYDYTVSLINGSVTLHDGKKMLLYNRPQDLDLFIE